MNTQEKLLNGFDLFNNTVLYNNSIPNNVKNETSNNIQSLKNMINSDKIDNNKLYDQLGYISNIFTTYLNSTGINADEKLYLTYAIRDIMDEVNLKMHEIVNKRTSESNKNPLSQAAVGITNYIYNTGIFFKIEDDKPIPLSEEDVIKSIQAFQNNIKNNPLLESLEKEQLEKKSVPSKIFNEIGNFFSTLGSKIKEIKLDEKQKKFDHIKGSMNLLHQQKENVEILAPIFDVQRDITAPLYNHILNTQHNLIKDMTNNLSPQEIFHGKTFEQFLENYIKKLYENDPLVIKKLMEGIGISNIETFRKRLAANLGVVLNDNNLSRLIIHMNLQLAEVIDYLRVFSDQPVSKDAFAKLLLPEKDPKDEKQFKEIMLNSIIGNLSILCSTEQKADESFQSNKMILNTLSNIIDVVGNVSSEEIIKRLAKSKITLDDVNTLLNKIPPLDKENQKLKFFGLAQQADNINAYRDMILLFGINTLLEKMVLITKLANEAKQKGGSIDVSGLQSKENAIEEIRNSFAVLADAIQHWVPLNYSVSQDILGRVLDELTLQLLICMLEFQGKGGVMDAATPLYKELFSKWREWLSK